MLTIFIYLFVVLNLIFAAQAMNAPRKVNIAKSYLVNRQEKQINRGKLRYKSASPEEQFHQAVKRANYTEADELLARNPYLVNTEFDGMMPLCVAASHGHLGMVMYLIDHESDINTTEKKDNRNALLWALTPKLTGKFAANEDIILSIAETLIDSGIAINASYDTTQTALSVAARLGYRAIIKLLIERGANIMHADGHGNTPLHTAIAHNRFLAAQMLLDYGADIEAENNGHQTPLHIAASYGHFELVNLLLFHGADRTKRDNNQQTPVQAALKNNHEAVVKLLLDASFLIDSDCDYNDTLNQTTQKQYTLLHLALMEKNANLAKMLIQRKAAINKLNIDGDNELHLGTRTCDPAIIRLLINIGVLMNVANTWGNRPIHDAAVLTEASIMQCFIDAKENINIRNKQGRTPLHMAAVRGNVDVIHVLLNNNAKPELPDIDGNLPTHLAALNGRDKALDALLNSQQGRIIINKTNDKNQNCLHLAIIKNSVSCAKILIEKDINILQKDLDDLDTLERAKKSSIDITQLIYNKMYRK